MIASTYNIPFILPLEMKLAAFLAALLAASTTNAGGYKRLEKCPRTWREEISPSFLEAIALPFILCPYADSTYLVAVA